MEFGDRFFIEWTLFCVYMCLFLYQDVGEPQLSNWTVLYISVADGDDQNPVFEHNMYSLSIEEQVCEITHEIILIMLLC